MVEYINGLIQKLFLLILHTDLTVYNAFLLFPYCILYFIIHKSFTKLCIMKYIFVIFNLVAITILLFLSPCYSNEEITTSFHRYKKYIPVPVPESVLEHYNYNIPMENQCYR